jgi:hypothetical protein
VASVNKKVQSMSNLYQKLAGPKKVLPRLDRGSRTAALGATSRFATRSRTADIHPSRPFAAVVAAGILRPWHCPLSLVRRTRTLQDRSDRPI